MSVSATTAHRLHLVVAGVAGLAVTVIEFGAVRFMAPSFGQSNYVWANVIGVILLALALGYWLGGRLADRSRSGRRLYAAYLMAAAYVTGIAFLGGEVCAWLVPEDVGSAELLPLAFTGSLAATVLLFGPPTLVLGMTSPFLIRLDQVAGHAGRVAGRIFAVGTLGSLAGCYVAPLWLIQAVGSRLTILLCAAALALLGAGGLLARSTRGGGTAATAVAVLLGVLGAGVWAVVEPRPLRSRPGQLAEVESAYQTIRVVVEEAEVLQPGDFPLYGDLVRVRTVLLRHDEDAETYQSVWVPGGGDDLLVGGRYYEHLALGAWFERPVAPDRLRVLVIGYAAGSVHRALRLTLPPATRLEVLGVEIDPEVIEVARRWLDLGSLEGSDLRLVTGEDARTVVNALDPAQRFDLVVVDAYARTAYVPFQLASREFFARLARHLRPGGWIGVNMHARRGLRSPLAQSIATTMDRAPGLGSTWAVPNPLYPTSFVLWAASEATGPPRLRADVRLPPGLRTAAYALERLAVRHVAGRDGGKVLTDDRSDVDRLTDAELLGP